MIKLEEKLDRRLQLVELDILKEFIMVCEKLNLKYFLEGGTLLGAIRHGGFIPWDDDIDVSMPREDYELFIKQGQSLLGEKYFIQNYQTDNEWIANFTKIRNSETTFIESSVKNLNINHGVYIDVFPMDGYNRKARIRNYINWKKYALYDIQISKKYSSTTKPISFKGKIAWLLSELFYGKTEIKDILIKKDKIAQKYKISNNDSVCCYSFATPIKGYYMPKSYYGEGVMKKFEDIEARAPEKYDQFLTRVFGDYMKLPPEEQRIAHHYNEVIDLEKSYKDYMNNDQIRNAEDKTF